MPYEILAAPRLSLQTLMVIGAIGGIVIIAWAFSNWRRAVKWAMVIALFEGALRKWVFPQGQELVYFLKDVVLIGAYFRFFFFPDPEIRRWRVNAPTGLIILCCTVVSFSAMNPNIGSPILALYGVKIYLLYVPLAFMMPLLFRSQDELVNGLTNYAMLATPICLLGVAQFAAGGDSWLNVYAQQSADQVGATTFGWADAKVRITGTFSYLTGHTVFCIFFTALHICLLTCNLPKWKYFLVMANLPLLLGNAFMGGSRSAILTTGLTIASFVVFSFFTRISEKKNIILILGAGGAIAVIGASFFFRDAQSEWKARSANATDSYYSRLVEHPVESMGKAMRESGAFGYGIGMAHPATDRLRHVLGIRPPKEKAPVFDSELAQVWGELGPMGFLAWYGLRVCVFIVSIGCFLRCQSLQLKPFLLGSIIIQAPHFIMSVVYNHTANILLFCAFGLSLVVTLTPAVSRGGVRGTAHPADPRQGFPPGRQRRA